jgi:hypothetical protein
MIGAKIHHFYFYLYLYNVQYTDPQSCRLRYSFQSQKDLCTVQFITHLVVHLYVVKDVEELLPCLDLVERNRHDVALGVVSNCLEK